MGSACARSLARNHKRSHKRPLIQNDSSSLTSPKPSRRTEVSSRRQMSMPDHDRQPFGRSVGRSVALSLCRSIPFIHNFTSAENRRVTHRSLSHLIERLLVRHLDPLQQFDGVLGALEARALDAQVVPQLLDAPLDRVPEVLAVAARPTDALLI